MPAYGGGEALSGPLPWASSPFSSARASRDQHDDPASAKPSENDRAIGVDPPSDPAPPEWPTSKPCEAGLRPPPAAAAALTGLAAQPLLATMGSTTMSG